MNVAGLATYFEVLVAPRRAFEQLASTRTWGWAALCGLALTLVALFLSEPAQLHILALSEAHRMASLPPGQRFQEQIAIAQIAPLRRTLFIVGAVSVPWLVWALISLFLFVVTVIGRGHPNLGNAWVAALNSYGVYGVTSVLNAALVALHNPATILGPSDLLRLPSPGWLFPHAPQLAAFLSAYNVGAIWYYAVVAIALEKLLRVPRVPSLVATFAYSLLYGVFAAIAGGAAP